MLYSGIYIYIRIYIYIVSDASPASLLLPHQPSGLVASQDSKDRPLERFSEEMGLKCGIPPPQFLNLVDGEDCRMMINHEIRGYPIVRQTQMLAFKRLIDCSHGCHLTAVSLVSQIWHASYESLAQCNVTRWCPPVEYIHILSYYSILIWYMIFVV